MPTTDKNILHRVYAVSIFFALVAVAIVVQIVRIQFVEGDEYRAKAEDRIFRNQMVEANRGNLYDSNGQLLATSITKYDIRFDAVAPSQKDFNAEIEPLASSLSRKLNKPKAYFLNKFRKARTNNSRYLHIADDINYTTLMELKSFPLFKRGANRGGLIVEPHVEREYPLGKMAERLVGYDEVGKPRVGLEGAYRNFLKGENGSRLEQKISGNQWKPINNVNEIEPKDGLDVYTTIDVNMQDVAHHALLEQLEYFEADHGTAVVMETATGEIKALSNLGRSSDGKYFEKRNYALWESHEPGSTFKLMSVIAALEDKVVDTSTVFDTQNGKISYYGRNVRDSKYGGYGKISVAKAFELSSNTALVQMVQDNYGSDPEKYVDRLYNMNLNDKLNLPIIGEGKPMIPHPDDENWSGLSLPWMGFGYGVRLTPLQTLTFYNAVANNGVMVKPRLIKEVRSKDKMIEKYDREIINPSICSQETIDKVKVMMENVVKRGTADNLYSSRFSMAGKTGTCQTEYWKGAGNYIASFAGYFPADKPKYSCIVVIHKPNTAKGYYGNIVAGPVFKKIAQKIYASNPQADEVELPNEVPTEIQKSLKSYYTKAQKTLKDLPDLRGMDAMDAIAIIENMGAQVKIVGSGKVKTQSIKPGTKLNTSHQVILTLS
ncbi:cell division protein FtsI (penicillin-binding protein 3) [Nonlabens sp. Hel1_33_55]|uniref:penicillin-binding protein n=1 Tax=Nonlabens sp. Hel1_33_55 TaxID=1336802 RepID=UPI000875B89C|nr:penicillin-binding protein [Nonlabens sp. Hel1_33_55]SCY24055.1 cell division protein FtsI (penicillin-binding protein 3) [Nonlabens sp. Hel1_33_55]